MMREKLIAIAREAGSRILDVYHRDFQVQYKGDHSPLTDADRASHEWIAQELHALDPGIPILSEEGRDIPYAVRKNWVRFWLVDPLDGTKEFVNRNGEFTVNISLIEHGYPVLGVIHIPVTGTTYYGEPGVGAVRIERQGEQRWLSVQQPSDDAITIVDSRSHPSAELESFMERLRHQYSVIHRISKGSALKFCLVAEGAAHLYPRMGPTMEWDTGAGQAIVEAAGGKVVWLDGTRVNYNKENLRNSHFVAKA